MCKENDRPDFSSISADSAEKVLAKTEARVFDDGGRPLNYRLYRSPACGGGRAAKLFVYLHGAGGRGDDNRLQIEDQCALMNYLASDSAEAALASIPYIVIAPQCPVGASWVSSPFDGGSYSLSNTPISEPLGSVYKLMQSLEKSEGINRGESVLTGISMGGYGTWDLAQRHPEEFRTAAPICGGGDPAEAERLRGVRLWAFHCTGDQSVPVSASRDMIKALAAAGISAAYTEFPREAHNAWTPAFEEVKYPLLIEWLVK